MPDYQQPSLLVKHLNNGLFADYYLDERLTTLPAWNEALFEAAKRTLEQIKTLRATLRPEALDEAQLEQQWIQPVLTLLGYYFAVQPKIRYWANKNRRPDYAFLATADEARAVTNAV